MFSRADIERVMRVMAIMSILTSIGCGASSPAQSAQAAPHVSSRQVHGIDTSRLEPGVLLHEHVIERGASRMKVWLYLPEGARDRPAGLVAIAAAGNVIGGMRLVLGDRPEHLPYVREGFAVVAYELDGPMEQGASDEQFLAAIDAFRQSRAGLENAGAAIDYALSVLPSGVERRLFAAGHSSAATHALLLAAEDPRIKAVAAFAPVTDLPAYLPAEFRDAVERASPGYNAFLQWMSPMSHAETLARKPVFLFHALNDELPSDNTERLMAAMKPAHPASTMVLVPSGGHYDSMIRDGVPKAVSWFQQLPDTSSN
jgi:dienelactone hydrolase